ncbi:MAG: hypothetical protein PHV68_07230 [Candidatus Gastranaerophilales bacterium]|nr:hypothetical protein [Candidatus Gastranaerophilales bacterium]
MKKTAILLSVFCVLALANSAKAISTEESTSETYLINHGHSQELSRIVNMQKKQINAEGSPKLRETWIGAPVRIIKKVFGYFDPCADDENFGENTIAHPEAL